MADSHLINEDLRPTRPEERTWSKWHIAALWVGMAVCIPTYMLAGGIMGAGASLGTATLAVAIGNIVVLIPLVLNAHPGTKYGIPFPVLLRSSFGVLGANIPAMMRAIVACGWFGINTFFGGIAVHTLAGVIFPDSWSIPDFVPEFLGISSGMLLSYLVFWGMQVFIIVRGMEMLRKLETLAAPFLLFIGVALFVWAWMKVGSLGDMLGDSSKAQLGTGDALIIGINGAVAFWGTLALNIPDFARYARSQKDQIVGQAIALPPTMTLYAFIGAAVTNATVIIFGTAIGDPVQLMAKIGGGPVVALFSMFALALATVSTNLAANIVSPANDISNLAPHKISFRKGAIIAAAFSFCYMPWKLAGDVMNWLGAYGAVLGAVGGVMIADYYIIRKKILNVDDLYERGGDYEYKGGFNPIALTALGLGVLVNLPGMLHALGYYDNPPGLFVDLYKWGWFVAFMVALTAHALGTTVLGDKSNLPKAQTR